MAHGLYSRAEIGRMTSSALDELLSYYGDTGNAEGMQRVRDEQDTRYDAYQAELDIAAEVAWEAEEDRRQQLHDEMIDNSMTEDGRWG